MLYKQSPDEQEQDSDANPNRAQTVEFSSGRMSIPAVASGRQGLVGGKNPRNSWTDSTTHHDTTARPSHCWSIFEVRYGVSIPDTASADGTILLDNVRFIGIVWNRRDPR